MSTAAPSFRKILAAYIQEHINEQKPLSISWVCAYCNGSHAGNLFKKVRSMDTDRSSDGYQADISLMDETGHLFVAIKLSKNKNPITDAVDYYRKQNIIYIQLCPSVVVSGETVADCLTNPKFVGTCLNPKCKKCGSFQYEKSMVIIDSECWKCKGQMKVAILDCSGSSCYLGPNAFSDDELTLARSKGALIKSNHSKMVGRAYLSNTCPSCQALTGNHYLFTDHFTAAINDYYTYQSFPVGYFCGDCYHCGG